ncbi:MAG TPA: molybdenum cofactor biosynthesis protein MoaE [Gemmatimonadota bacterium]|nr:molybdenum cofactor biosynthesis protein MoaE [Gemmatimonadota bacterium]
MRTFYQITDAPIDPEGLRDAIADPASGAIATFVGVTRNSFAGKRVVHLEYEAYGPMAEQEMQRIGMEIAGSWPAVTGVAIAHRIGRVEVGEASVAIAISAPHRREALAACAHGIDRLKATLPVWKKEVFADGSEWRENRGEEEELDGGR